jgi:hypothetical protein
MADISVGDISSKLSIDISEWQRGLLQASQQAVQFEQGLSRQLNPSLQQAGTQIAAGAPKDAMIAARNTVKGVRDADVFFMNMMTQSFELIWRYTCSRTYLRP